MNLLTNYKYQYDTGMQYHFGITAFLIYASVLNIRELKMQPRRIILSVAAVFCCCFYFCLIIPRAGSYIQTWTNGHEKYTRMEEILEQIPEDASLAVSPHILAHVADRDEVYAINYHENEGNVDYVIYDKRYSIEEDDVADYLMQGYRASEIGEEYFLILEKTD